MWIGYVHPKDMVCKLLEVILQFIHHHARVWKVFSHVKVSVFLKVTNLAFLKMLQFADNTFLTQ